MQYSNCQNRVSPRIFYAIQIKYHPVYLNDPIGQNSNLEKPHRPNFNFWRAKPHWLIQFKSVYPKLTIKKHLDVLPTGIPTKLIMVSEV